METLNHHCQQQQQQQKQDQVNHEETESIMPSLRSPSMETRPPISFAFQNLSCHAQASITPQSAFFTAFSYIRNLLSSLDRGRPLPRTEPRTQILVNFSGLLYSGEMLLVLGRPGSGCSTFLKTLAGEARGLLIGDETEFNYQGLCYEDFHRIYSRERIYVPELDTHFPDLKLGETLEFAAAVGGLGPRSSARYTVKDCQATARAVASRLRLEGSYNTLVGSPLLRGLSGGEKRRTSIAEAVIGGAHLQCWDNTTRGLDSATAQDVVEMLRDAVVGEQSTIVMSLYQASETIYRKFDKVTLLYRGHQIYFGPTELAAEYFISLGFQRPKRSTTADFLTSLTNPAERIIRPGYESRVPRSPAEFEAVWRQGDMGRALGLEMDTFRSVHPLRCCPKAKGAMLSKTAVKQSAFPTPIHKQILSCLARAVRRFRNDPRPVTASIAANSVLGIIIGSSFYNLGQGADDINQRAILLFFAVMTNAFTPAFEVVLMWAQRPIVEKHKRYGFYRPFTERLTSLIFDLPAKLLTALMIHLPLYFLSNLRRAPGAFLTYMAIMLANMLTMSMLFRMIGSVSRTREQTTVPVSLFILVMICYTGFVVPRDYMVPWLRWWWWVNPPAYAYESVMINEFSGGRIFECDPLRNMVPFGPGYGYVSLQEKVCLASAMSGQPGETGVYGERYIGLRYGYQDQTHLWRNLGITVAMMSAFLLVHLLAAEYIPAQNSRGEVLTFKHGSSKKQVIRAQDEAPPVTPAALVRGDSPELSTDHDGLSRSQLEKTDKANPNLETVLPLSYKPPTSVGSESDREEKGALLYWNNLTYSIQTAQGPRVILSDLYGWIKPGTLTALMGVTGAGKTSLLDVLARRTLAAGAQVDGEIYVQSSPSYMTATIGIGYVQQNDIHLASSTVREALQFSALLRQPDSKESHQKLAYVETVLEMLDMESFADAIVGSPGEGLNIEQRRRLSIAIEVVSQPDQLLFLDEPTSGLDSQTSWQICTLLRKLANTGHTLLCTIHQPSAQLFSLFDRLLLLDQGGNVLYFGDIGSKPQFSTLTRYFENNGARKCAFGENPAEWMLEVTGDSRTRNNTMPRLSHSGYADSSITQQIGEQGHQDWAEIWQSSEEKKHVLGQIAEFKSNTEPASALTPSKEMPSQEVFHINNQEPQFATTYSRQFLVVSKRVFLDHWRDPVYLPARLAIYAGTALVNGFSFYRANANPTIDIQNTTNIIFSIFLLAQLFSAVPSMVMPRLKIARDLFEARERDAKMYSWAVFVGAHLLAEAAWQTLGAVVVFAGWYFPTGTFNTGGGGSSERAGLALVTIWLYCLWMGTLTQTLALTTQVETAEPNAFLIYWMSLVFCGILVPINSLTRFWTFMYYISPLTYFVKGMITAKLADRPIACSDAETVRIPLPRGNVSNNDNNNNNLTCDNYLAEYIELTGAQGYVPDKNPVTGAGGSAGSLDDSSGTNIICLLCPLSETNNLLETNFNIDTGAETWRNAGILGVYVVFNAIVVFLVYGLVTRKAAVRQFGKHKNTRAYCRLVEGFDGEVK